MFAGGAVAPFATLRRCKFRDHTKLCLHHGDDHQLRQPLHRIQHEGRVAAVPGADLQLALVVAVDQADDYTRAYRLILTLHE